MINSECRDRLQRLAELICSGESHYESGALKVGVDLGTANIAIVVVDSDDWPVAGITHPSKVVKDGIVVDFLAASRIISTLKRTVEQRLGCTLERAATAIPPGISVGNINVITNVVESAGFTVTNVIDEPVAAACALSIDDGAVVDVGGGTTGMSIVKQGNILFSADEPTGGSHMTLVLSGALGLSYDDAEEVKMARENEEQVFTLVRPVVEKMANLVSTWLVNQSVKHLWLVGGATSFRQFPDVFNQITGIESIAVPQPLLVTPLGIAMKAK